MRECGGPRRCGASGPLLFAVPAFRAVSCLPRRAGLLGVPEPRRFGPPCLLVRGGLRVWSAMWLCTDQSCPPVTNVARNSPPHISDFEIRPLELQRLWAISKNDRVKLRAKCGWGLSRWRVSAPQPGSPDRRVLRAPRRGSMEDAFCLIYRPFMASCQQAIFLGP